MAVHLEGDAELCDQAQDRAPKADLGEGGDAQRIGRLDDAAFRQRLLSIWSRLRIMRWNAMRMLSVSDADRGKAAGPEMTLKLFWATLHRDMGEVAMDALGAEATVVAGGGHAYSPNESELKKEPHCLAGS